MVTTPPHVGGENLQHRIRVRLRLTGEQQVAVRLIRIRALCALADARDAVVRGARRARERRLHLYHRGGLGADVILQRHEVEVLVRIPERDRTDRRT